MGLSLGGIARGAGRVGGQMAQAGANFHEVRRQKQAQKQAQLMEMMKAGFQPVSQQPGGPAPGGAAPSGILQRIARALAGSPSNAGYEMAPWHQAQQAEAQRSHETSMQETGIQGELDVAELKEGYADGRARGQWKHEKVLAGLEETTRRFGMQLEHQLGKERNQIAWSQLAWGKEEAGMRMDLERELKNRGLDLEKAKIEEDEGRYYISDSAGNIFVLDRETGTVEQVDTQGTKEVDTAQRSQAILSEIELLTQMKGLDIELTESDEDRIKELYQEYRSLQPGATTSGAPNAPSAPGTKAAEYDQVLFPKGKETKVTY